MSMGTDNYQFDENGRITSPGKFEGEMVYMPYYYGQSLDGTAEINSGRVVIEVIPEDRESLQEDINGELVYDRKLGLMIAMKRLKKRRSIRFLERDDGLVQQV